MSSSYLHVAIICRLFYQSCLCSYHSRVRAPNPDVSVAFSLLYDVINKQMQEYSEGAFVVASNHLSLLLVPAYTLQQENQACAKNCTNWRCLIQLYHCFESTERTLFDHLGLQEHTDIT